MSAAPAVRYTVQHETRYQYAAPVSTSQHVAHLRMRELPRQRVLDHRLDITPAPAEIESRIDYFGNTASYFAIMKPHQELVAIASSTVERQPPPTVEAVISPPWEEVRDGHKYVKGRSTDPSFEFTFASPYITRHAELVEYARPSFPPGQSLHAGAVDLMHRIHAEFQFDSKATTVMTPVRTVLAERRGVCQDFAHLQIACLRSLGLSARYVSGYLLTDPPPGQPRLIGADASHAWLSVYCPANGWVDLDPTNDVLPEMRHVTVAWGRDYGDVSPLRGVVLGGSHHALHVAVSVVPVDGAA